MAEMKTKPTAVTAADFIAAVEHPGKRADAAVLDALVHELDAAGPPEPVAAEHWDEAGPSSGEAGTGVVDAPDAGAGSEEEEAGASEEAPS